MLRRLTAVDAKLRFRLHETEKAGVKLTVEISIELKKSGAPAIPRQHDSTSDRASDWLIPNPEYDSCHWLSRVARASRAQWVTIVTGLT